MNIMNKITSEHGKSSLFFCIFGAVVLPQTNAYGFTTNECLLLMDYFNVNFSKIMDFLFYFHFYCTKRKQNLSKADCLNNKSFPEIDQSERRKKHGGKNLN